MAVPILAAAGAMAAKAGLAGMLGPVGWIALGAPVIWGVYEYFHKEMEAAQAEGIKEGYEKASREYAAKLSAQAQEFMTQLAELTEKIERLRRERDEARTLAQRALSLFSSFFGSNPAKNLDREEQAIIAQEKALTEKGFTLLGKFEGCITKAEEQGIFIDEETQKCYDKLKDITDSIKINTKLTTEAA